MVLGQLTPQHFLDSSGKISKRSDERDSDRFTPTFQFSLSPTPLYHNICSKLLQNHQCNTLNSSNNYHMSERVPKFPSFAFWVILAVLMQNI